MKNLAMQYPSLVRPITLNHRSILGRDVNGIEISTGAQNTGDGKPIFLIMGVHHAREWPSAEHTIEFAYDLLRNYGTRRPHDAARQQTRTIVVPVVNPDGFNISREAAALGDFSLFDYEMKRKNCRVSANTPPQVRERRLRGQPGRPAARHRPQPQLRRALGRQRREHELVGRHLPRRRAVLGARGPEHPRADLDAAGHEPDHEPHLLEPGAAPAGRRRASAPRSRSRCTRRSARRWPRTTATRTSRASGSTTPPARPRTGRSGRPAALAFTFEIGGDRVPPAVPRRRRGRVPRPRARGRRGQGRQPRGVLRDARGDRRQVAALGDRRLGAGGLDAEDPKTFQTSTSPVWQDDFGTASATRGRSPDTLESELKAAGGSFEWNVNPSTRPVVAGRDGRDPTGRRRTRSRCRTRRRAGREHGRPARRPARGDPVHVQGRRRRGQRPDDRPHRLGDPETDWDVYVIGPSGDIVTQSASFGDTTEDAVAVRPAAGAVHGGGGQLRPGR